MSISKAAPGNRFKQEQFYICLARHCQMSICQSVPLID